MTELTEHEKIRIEVEKAFRTLDECDWCEEKFIPDSKTIEGTTDNGTETIFCSGDCEWKYCENESATRDLFSDDEGY